MALIDNVDYTNKKIYLSVDSINQNIDTLDIYREVRALRRTVENHQKYKPIIIAGGNIEKIPNVSYTPAFVQLLYGTRIIPYDTIHQLTLIRDTFSDDGVTGAAIFDRSSVTAEVDIDVNFPAIEIRTISTSATPAGLTPAQEAMLLAISSDTSLIPILL